jgi:hypothetical protein
MRRRTPIAVCDDVLLLRYATTPPYYGMRRRPLIAVSRCLPQTPHGPAHASASRARSRRGHAAARRIADSDALRLESPLDATRLVGSRLHLHALHTHTSFAPDPRRTHAFKFRTDGTYSAQNPSAACLEPVRARFSRPWRLSVGSTASPESARSRRNRRRSLGWAGHAGLSVLAVWAG